MWPTLLRRAQYGTQSDGFGGINPWQQRPDYKTYRSKYGPQYKVGPHLHGINYRHVVRYSIMGAMFGGSGLFFLLFFFNDVPRVREDILMKLPGVGEYFHKETPPEDDPF